MGGCVGMKARMQKHLPISFCSYVLNTYVSQVRSRAVCGEKKKKKHAQYMGAKRCRLSSLVHDLGLGVHLHLHLSLGLGLGHSRRIQSRHPVQCGDARPTPTRQCTVLPPAALTYRLLSPFRLLVYENIFPCASVGSLWSSSSSSSCHHRPT